MYTSGTTGTPKGVPLTHANIVAELEGVNLVLKLSDKEKILSLLAAFSRVFADRKYVDRDDLRLRGRLLKRTDARRTEQGDESIQADDPHDRAAALVSVSQKDIRRRQSQTEIRSDAFQSDARRSTARSATHCGINLGRKFFGAGARIIWRKTADCDLGRFAF